MDQTMAGVSYPYDEVTNAVSVDYLTKPLEMMKEVNRVLKPGGLAVRRETGRGRGRGEVLCSYSYKEGSVFLVRTRLRGVSQSLVSHVS